MIVLYCVVLCCIVSRPLRLETTSTASSTSSSSLSISTILLIPPGIIVQFCYSAILLFSSHPLVPGLVEALAWMLLSSGEKVEFVWLVVGKSDGTTSGYTTSYETTWTGVIA
jgi:hypothetical protein